MQRNILKKYGSTEDQFISEIDRLKLLTICTNINVHLAMLELIMSGDIHEENKTSS